MGFFLWWCGELPKPCIYEIKTWKVSTLRLPITSFWEYSKQPRHVNVAAGCCGLLQPPAAQSRAAPIPQQTPPGSITAAFLDSFRFISISSSAATWKFVWWLLRKGQKYSTPGSYLWMTSVPVWPQALFIMFVLKDLRGQTAAAVSVSLRCPCDQTCPDGSPPVTCLCRSSLQRQGQFLQTGEEFRRVCS